ncbi:Mu-like prophage FluMu protein gp29 [Desulfovibrio sp. DV]|uniref:DUF935 domain-containing protein n=1 Tax=Desulfovibrio sp. DV TaxID=1844708 RepID=UPI00094B9383|nr:DUF935 domain-containing protein [Desulfovibrio sp. DV]OLN30436.1 Mu-like prophage FluMu protein gp29 [Desulfovibrio sp. DV]
MTTMIDRLKAAFTAFKGGARGGMQTASLGALHNDYIASLTGGLTPKRLEALLRAADDGDIVGQHTLFAEIEDRDEHIHAELSKRRRALLSIPWRIEPGKAGGKGAEAVAGAVREQVEAIPDFEDMILDMADAIGHGFACLEFEWSHDGSRHLPAGLHLRPQNWFMLARDGSLRLRDNTPEGQELWGLGWIVHQHRSKSGIFARAGLFRVLCWTYLLKQYCRGDFSQFLEIHGLPMRLGKYPANTSDEEQKTLLTALRALGSDAAGIIPEGMEIEFKEAARGSEKPFMAMHDLCETGQSKAILGSTLTTDTKGVGSQALGEIHNEVRLDILASDARQLAGSLTRQLLAPLAYLNEGVTDPGLLPRFVFDPSRPEDLEKLAKSLPDLAEVMDIPTRWAHERAGIPLPEDGEPVLVRKSQGKASGNDRDEPGQAGKAKAEATAALTAEGGDDPRYPDQDAVDAAEVPEAVLTALARDMLAPIFAEAENGVAPEALLGKLAELYPRMDTTALEELTARVLFVGELWGRLSAQAEAE